MWLQVFKRAWFQGRRCLDIGCNSGAITLSIAAQLAPRSMLGVDIDASLIKKACRCTAPAGVLGMGSSLCCLLDVHMHIPRLLHLLDTNCSWVTAGQAPCVMGSFDAVTYAPAVLSPSKGQR